MSLPKMPELPEPSFWMTNYAVRSMARGGTRGATPVHKHKSRDATHGLYTQAQMDALHEAWNAYAQQVVVEATQSLALLGLSYDDEHAEQVVLDGIAAIRARLAPTTKT